MWGIFSELIQILDSGSPLMWFFLNSPRPKPFVPGSAAYDPTDAKTTLQMRRSHFRYMEYWLALKGNWLFSLVANFVFVSLGDQQTFFPLTSFLLPLNVLISSIISSSTKKKKPSRQPLSETTKQKLAEILERHPTPKSRCLDRSAAKTENNPPL